MASASERTNSAYAAPKGYDANYQLKNGGAMTDVESSSMSVRGPSSAPPPLLHPWRLHPPCARSDSQVQWQGADRMTWMVAGGEDFRRWPGWHRCKEGICQVLARRLWCVASHTPFPLNVP